MKPQECKLTIGLPIFNEEKRIERTLDGLAEQTCPDFRILVFDNCSTDRTGEILRRYAERDSRIRIHRNDRNIGAIGNFKACLAACETPYFKWLAADDALAPEYLARTLEVLESNPSVVAVQTAHIIFNDAGPLRQVHLSDRTRSFDWRSTVRLVSSKAKANYFIYGVFRTEHLRAMYLDLQPMPSSDRWFLTGMPRDGLLYYIEDALHYRYQNPIPFDQRYATDPLAQTRRMRFFSLARTLNQVVNGLTPSAWLHLNTHFLKWYAIWKWTLFKRRARAWRKRMKKALAA